MKKSLAAFVCGLVVLAFAAVHLNQNVFGGEGRYLNVAELEAFLDQKTPKTADDAVYYWIVGNVYYDRGNLDRAISAYEMSLLLNPDNPDPLNNLAWLLATSADPVLRDPERALALAQQAIALKKAPHIWDTLAESFFQNGRLEEAIAAEEQALAMNPEDRTIYEAQLEKFKNALN